MVEDEAGIHHILAEHFKERWTKHQSSILNWLPPILITMMPNQNENLLLPIAKEGIRVAVHC